MQQVSKESIQKALDKIDGLNEDGLDRLIETYTLKHQPLVDYILLSGEEFENEDVNVFAMYYFAIMAEAFYQEGIELAPITEQMIEDFQEPYHLALDAIFNGEDFEPMQDLVQQHHLQQFMLEEIESPDSDGVILEDEVQTQLYIVTTSVIGIMHSAVRTSA